MRNFLRHGISTIFVMLGSRCNFNCIYCSQHTPKGITTQLPETFNPDVLEFIYEVINNNDKPLLIQFYGGEPLLYYGQIKYIVSELKKKYPDNSDLNLYSLSMITNGSLLTDEMVEFFNENKINLSVSWDGKNSKNTRHHSVFEDEELRNRLFKLERLSVSGVLSSYVYPKELVESFQEIDREYYKLTNNHIHVNMDEIFDTGCQERSLFNIDYDRVQKEIKELAEWYFDGKQLKLDCTEEEFNLNHYAKASIFDKLFSSISTYVYKDGVVEDSLAFCGNGFYVYNIDMQGNLYTCHNSSIKLGDIYSDYGMYISNLIKYDDTKQDRIDLECEDCSVYSICRGGCKLLDVNAKQETYCKLKKAVFLPFIEVLLERGVSPDNG